MSDQIQKPQSSKTESVSRRDFIKIGSAIAATSGAIASTALQPSVVRAASANGKIRIGFIGPGGRGFNAHVKTLSKLCAAGQPIELVAV